MTDLVFVAGLLGFFALALAYVVGCARIVGDSRVVRVGDGWADGVADGEGGDVVESGADER